MENYDFDTERSPEQIEAIAARKVRIFEDREKATIERAARARRRVIDAEATARMLVAKKLVTKAWVNRKTPEELRKYVRIACIAFEVDAISVMGNNIEILTIIMQRKRNG